MTEQKLQVVPLGGLGEFGMNMTALRFGDEIIVISIVRGADPRNPRTADR